jgi:carbonic anhydrase
MKVSVSVVTLVMLLTFLSACGDSDADNSNKSELMVVTDEVMEADSSARGQAQYSTIHKPTEKVTDWQSALTYLEEGNKRYINDQTIARTTNKADRELLGEGQQPFAVIVTCSDSRAVPEIYFDQKLGDIFVIRNAGNIADETTLGSIEYATKQLQVPLVVVVGHSSCGAVDAAFEGAEFPGDLQSIISRIETSIEGSSDLDQAIHKNIESVVKQVAENEIVKETNTKVMGAFYNIVSGEILWN